MLFINKGRKTGMLLACALSIKHILEGGEKEVVVVGPSKIETIMKILKREGCDVENEPIYKTTEMIDGIFIKKLETPILIGYKVKLK